MINSTFYCMLQVIFKFMFTDMFKVITKTRYLFSENS